MNWFDNSVIRAVGRFCDLIELNILWVLCSLPIVTIGASTSALYYVMLKFVKNEEGYIVRSFFKAFKENLKKSTIIWFIIIILACAIGVDIRIIGMLQLGTTLKVILGGVIIFVGFMLVGLTLYAFPMTARYENTLKQTIKNSLLLSVLKLPYTILMVLVIVGAVVLTFFNMKTLSIGILIWMLGGASLLAWVNSHILRKAFSVFDENVSDQTE